MRRSTIVLIMTAGFFLITAYGIFAQSAPQAVIREMTGTVELKQAGAVNWEPAVRGQTLTGDTAVSTGFRSTALITLGDSTITVQPLTRLTLAELSRSQNTEKIELNLSTGRIRAEVRPPAGSTANFTVTGPSATASVRGTTFEFDTLNLTVSEGTVSFAGKSGAPVLVDAGGLSFVDERSGRAAPTAELMQAELRPELPVALPSLTPDRPAEIPRENTLDVNVIIRFQ